MRRTLLTIGIPLLIMCVARLLVPGFAISFGGMDISFAVLGCLVAGSLLVLSSPSWQHIDFRALYTSGAIMTFALTIICIATPTFWGERATYVSLLDIFVALEGCIMLMLSSLEKKAGALPFYAALGLIGQLELQRLRKALQPSDTPFRPHYS